MSRLDPASLLVGAGLAAVVAGLGLAAGILDQGSWPSIALAAVVMAAVGVALARAKQPRTVIDVAAAAAAGRDHLHREISRARRHERPLAVARIPRVREGILAQRLSSGPRRPLRRTDVAWADPTGLYLVMPETDRVAAGRAVGRVAEALGIEPSAVRLAVFPVDGLTSGALMAVLESEPAVPTPRAIATEAGLDVDDRERRVVVG